jgi:hypothetical protein
LVRTNSFYKARLEVEDEDVMLFDKRYDPENQYRLTLLYGGVESEEEAFFYQDQYWVGTNSRIIPRYITSVKKIDPLNSLK